MDLSGARADPSPYLGSGNTNGTRASEVEHPVQGMNCHLNLRPLALHCVRAQTVPDHLLEARHRRLGSGAQVVSRCFMPGGPAVFGDAVKVSVPLSWCHIGRVARHRVGTWRHDDGRLGMALGDTGCDALLVVGAVAGERGERAYHLVEQRADLGAIVGIMAGQHGGEDLPGIGVHPEVQLAPGLACLRFVLFKQPLPYAGIPLATSLSRAASAKMAVIQPRRNARSRRATVE